MATSDLDERQLSPARIVMVVDHIETGEPRALVEMPGFVAVPADRADRIVALINQAYAQLAAAVEACAVDDPAWREHARRIGATIDELHQTGAPKDRGQRALAHYDRQRAAGRRHSTALLEEAAKRGGIVKRRLEQPLQKRNNLK
jgi:hypothetical protein